MQPTTKTQLQLYFFFLAITIAFYGITYKAGFTTDFMGWLHDYDKYSFSTVINSEQHEYKSLYQFTHLLMYGLTFLFGHDGLPWFLVFVCLFALNAFFVFNIFNQLFKESGVENNFMIALIGVLMCLLSPCQAEVVVWRASFHYLIGFAMMLGIIQLSLKFYDTSQPKYFYSAILIFIFSAFSIEYFLFTPVIVALFLILKSRQAGIRYQVSGISSKLSPISYQPSAEMHSKSEIRNPKSLVLCLFAVVAGYFILHYAIMGHPFAHGRNVSNINIFSREGISTYGKYFFKELFLIRYLEHPLKEKFFSYFDKDWSVGFIAGLTICSVLLGIYYFNKFSARNKFIFLCFLVYSLLLLPVLPLSFNWILYSKNDRYGYLPSAFLFMGVSLALSYLPKKIFYAISCAYLLFSVYWLVKTNRIWMKSERVVSTISNNFHYWDAKEIFILNAPDNYSGMDMFGEWSDSSGVVVAAEVYQKKKFAGNAVDILQYNMTVPWNGVNVHSIGKDTLLVSFNEWGNWWIRKGRGAESYETTDYKVITDYKNCGRCYALILKTKNPGRVYLYQEGADLKEVKIVN